MPHGVPAINRTLAFIRVEPKRTKMRAITRKTNIRADADQTLFSGMRAEKTLRTMMRRRASASTPLPAMSTPRVHARKICAVTKEQNVCAEVV